MRPKERPQTPKPDVRPMAVCHHTFQFLRQETRNERHNYAPAWQTYDVFFCTHCLQRREVLARSDYSEFTGPRNEAIR